MQYSTHKMAKFDLRSLDRTRNGHHNLQLALFEPFEKESERGEQNILRLLER